MKRALLILICSRSPLHAATLTLDQYAATLTRIRNLIAAGDINTARAEATTLAGDDVVSPNGRFHTDTTLVAEISKAKPRDLGVETRIDATIAALRTHRTVETCRDRSAAAARVCSASRPFPSFGAAATFAASSRTTPLLRTRRERHHATRRNGSSKRSRSSSTG